MMEPASDDDSVLSSGDEMLNMVVPFSQDSATSPATQKVKGKKSESDDDDSHDNNNNKNNNGTNADSNKDRQRVEGKTNNNSS